MEMRKYKCWSGSLEKKHIPADSPSDAARMYCAIVDGYKTETTGHKVSVYDEDSGHMYNYFVVGMSERIYHAVYED